MLPEFRGYTLEREEKSFRKVIIISLLINMSSIGYALYYSQTGLFYNCVVQILITLCSYLIYRKDRDWGYHIFLLGYLAVFTISSFTQTLYYGSPLLVVGTALIPLFLWTSSKIRLFYLVVSLICGAIIIWKIPDSNSRVEDLRYIYEMVFYASLVSAMIIMNYLFVDGLNRNQIQLEKDEQILKQQNQLIQDQVDALDQQNKDLNKYLDSNTKLKQFAHIASHDLKAPLRTISSFAGLLRRRASDQLDEEQNEYLTFIEDGARKMSSLVNDLLEYSKVDSQKLNLSKIDVKDYIEELVNNLDTLIKERKAIIVVKDLPDSLVCDGIKLRQVFQNLISNAVKFVPEDRQPYVEISAKKINNFWKFFVSDNGIGIAKEHYNAIFEPFAKINKDEDFEGTGLGLLICKRIAELHNGEVSLVSTLGKGSIFAFTIQERV